MSEVRGRLPERPAVETTDRPDRRTWTFTPRIPGLPEVDVPPGPWDDEPDKIQWIDKATDLDCLMVRNRFGAWCGYVGVPRRHPLHGIDYEMVNVRVHGGLTFAEHCTPGEPIDGICHIAEPGREESPWWFEFDCAHYYDVQPGTLALYDDLPLMPDAVYRTEGYVRAEVEALAEQLAAVA